MCTLHNATKHGTLRNQEMRGKLPEEEKNIPHPRYKVELTRTLSVLLHSQKRQTTGQNILKLIMQRKVHHAAPFMAHVCSKNVYKNIKIRETILVSIQHELSVNSDLCLQLKFSLMQTYPTWSKVDQNVHGWRADQNNVRIVREGCLPRIDSLISTVLEQASETYIEPRRNVWSRLAGFHKTFLKNLAHRRRSFEQTAMTVSCQYGIRVGLGRIQRSFSYHPGRPPGDKCSAITRS